MKKQMRKIVLLFVMLGLIQSVVYADTMQLIYDGAVHFYDSLPISLHINGEAIETTVMPPIQFNGAVVVPAREVFSTLGAEVEWRPLEQSVYIHNDTDLIVLKINSDEAWVNGEVRTLLMPAKLINDKVMVPIRFISEALGYYVNWDASVRGIFIESEIGTPVVPPIEEVVPEGDLVIEEEDNNIILPDEEALAVNGMYYDSSTQMMVLNFPVALEDIIVDEQYHQKQIVVTLQGMYQEVLQSGYWLETGILKDLSIIHGVGQTQIIFTTDTIQALRVEVQTQQVYFYLVKPSEKYSKIIVLDAGHGDHDPGTTYGDVKEKDLTLAISTAVEARLKENADLKVYVTRSDDSFLQLMERAEFSNQIEPDLFISIHINSVNNVPTASGTETYYTEKADGRNKIFATMVQEALVSEFGTKDRGVKANTFVVTRYTNAPAILIEIGFLTNEADRAMMLADTFTTRYAEVIYGCILNYYASGYADGKL